MRQAVSIISASCLRVPMIGEMASHPGLRQRLSLPIDGTRSNLVDPCQRNTNVDSIVLASPSIVGESSLMYLIYEATSSTSTLVSLDICQSLSGTRSFINGSIWIVIILSFWQMGCKAQTEATGCEAIKHN